MSAVIRAVFGYVFLILMVRIAGRRPGKQMTPFEFVPIFFMGGATLTAMVGEDRSLTNALLQIVSIASAHFVLTKAAYRSERFAKLFHGTPLVLMNRGTWNSDTMARMRIQENDVMAMARDQGIAWAG